MTQEKTEKAKAAAKHKPTHEHNSAKLEPTRPAESWGDFFKGVVQEFHKIAWPSVPQIWGNTIIVIVMVTLMSSGIWAVDNVFRGILWMLTQVIPAQLGF